MIDALLRWLIYLDDRCFPEMIDLLKWLMLSWEDWFADRIDAFLRWLICWNDWCFPEMIDLLKWVMILWKFEWKHDSSMEPKEVFYLRLLTPWKYHVPPTKFCHGNFKTVFYLRLLTGLSKLWYLRRRRKFQLPISQHRLYTFHPKKMTKYIQNIYKKYKNTDCTLFINER